MLRKLALLAWKEVTLTFRDVGALIYMLATPIALTLIIVAAFGGGDTPLKNIPVLLLDQDQAQMSSVIEEALTSEDVGDLLVVETVTDESAARQIIDDGDAAALVIVPEGFSERVLPIIGALGLEGQDLSSLTESLDPQSLSNEQQQALTTFTQLAEEQPPAVIEIYANPDWRISTAVVKSIVQAVVEGIHMNTQGMGIVFNELLFSPEVAAQIEGDEETVTQALWARGQAIGQTMGQAMDMSSTDAVVDTRISLETTSSGRTFNWLDYMATGMAVLFLMFAAMSGARTLLVEQQDGTLSRLLITPTPTWLILLGKMAGVVVTGILQVTVLWGATSLFGAYWGAPLPVLCTILLLVLMASSIAALLAAWCTSRGQAAALGSAISLVAAATSGSFLRREGLPQWLQTASLFSPNAWGIEAFSLLQGGHGFAAVLPIYGGMLLLTAIYYAIAWAGLRRRFG